MPEGEDTLPFGLTITLDASKRDDSTVLFEGQISKTAGQPVYYYWSVDREDQATDRCIEGTNISELIVYDDRDGVDLARFVGGAWVKEPAGEEATAICNQLKQDYGTFKSLRPAVQSPDKERDARIAARMAEIEAEQQAKTNDNGRDR